MENELKKYRFLKGQITQKELAVAVGVSRQTIISIEKGKFNPSVKLALLFAGYFGCKVEDLFHIKKEES